MALENNNTKGWMEKNFLQQIVNDKVIEKRLNVDKPHNIDASQTTDTLDQT